MDLNQISTSNVIAAILSLIIPGLGQIIQGRVGLGILMFLLAAVLWVVLLGWLVHLWSVLDALFYKTKVTP